MAEVPPGERDQGAEALVGPEANGHLVAKPARSRAALESASVGLVVAGPIFLGRKCAAIDLAAVARPEADTCP
jgi:hypothetical protein